jgi:beta-lactamase class D
MLAYCWQGHQNRIVLKFKTLNQQISQNISRCTQRLILIDVYQLFQNALTFSYAILSLKGERTAWTASINKFNATNQAVAMSKTYVFSTTLAKYLASSTAINTPRRAKEIRQNPNYCFFHNTSLYILILI